MKRFSIFYAIAQAYLWVWYRVYYRRVRIIREEKLRNRGPVLFTPNHQNALMDPMAIICSAPHQPYFLARADIFKNPFIAKLLRRIKILTVYRIRDGADALAKNQEIFEKTVDIFKNDAVLGVFPEANHAPFKRLRGLKKGVPRIAFIAENAEDFNLNLIIVPVGINYSEYEHANANLLIHYGKAIPVSRFKEAYESNQVKAQNQLRDAIQVELKKLIIDIEHEADYDFIDQFIHFFRIAYLRFVKQKINIINEHRASRTLVDKLSNLRNNNPDDYESLKTETVNLFHAFRKKNVTAIDFYNYEMIKPHYLLYHASELLFAPLALPAFLIFGLPHLGLKKLLDKKVKDRTFYSTFYFATGWIIFSIWLLLCAIVVATVFHSAWAGLVFYLAAIAFGKISFRWFGRFLRLRSFFKVRKLLAREPQLAKELERIQEQIIWPLFKKNHD